MNLSHHVQLCRSPDSILRLILACYQVYLIYFKIFTEKILFYLNTWRIENDT